MLAANLVPKALKKKADGRKGGRAGRVVPRCPTDPDTAQPEVERWRHKFDSEDECLSTSAWKTLQTTQMALFPNIKCVLKMFQILPVGTC